MVAMIEDCVSSVLEVVVVAVSFVEQGVVVVIVVICKHCFSANAC
jgi:hypothetical protein